MPSKPALLPSPQIIKQLAEAGWSPEVLSQLIIKDRKAKHKFAEKNAIMGGITFIVVVAAFVYLIMHGHEYAAGTLLGVEVLAIVRLMLENRL